MKLAAIRQPVTPTEALQLNSKVKNWKEKHCNLSIKDDNEPVRKKYRSVFFM
jgi:hypothetical protein